LKKNDAFEGIKKTGVSERLEIYLEHLKKGLGYKASAVKAKLSYDTIMKQRKVKGFRTLEQEAESTIDGEIEDALTQAALSGNVGALALWLKYRRNWSEPRTIVTAEVNENKSINYQAGVKIELTDGDRASLSAFLAIASRDPRFGDQNGSTGMVKVQGENG